MFSVVFGQPAPTELQALTPFLQVGPGSIWANLFWLVVVFLLMLVLNRWITLHVNGLGLLLSGSQGVATWFYFFLFLPGILIHELSHYLIAILLRARPGKFTLWPQSRRGRVVLGSVEVRTDNPLVHSLIGVAPLVFGSLAVWLIAQFLRFDQLAEAASSGSLEQLFRVLGDILITPDFWLWLYLLFAIANAMMPSPADRLYWRPVLLFFGGIGLLLVGFGLTPDIPPIFEDIFANIIAVLVFALTTVVVVDLLFMAIILAAELILSLVTRRRIQY